MMAAPREYSNIRVESSETLTWIVLDRPEAANALSQDLLEEFSDALSYLKDNGAPVIAIRGEGRGFSSGYDIGAVEKATGEANPVADRDRLQGYIDRYLEMWDHPKPIITAVHGYCIAGATQMCVFSDITVTAEDARIGEPALPMGGGFIAPLWATLVGPKRAKEFSFIAGNSIDGRTAVEWGWANRSVPAGELISAVEGLAAQISRTPPDVLRIKKLSINRATETMGFRKVSAGVAEMDALLHAAPVVHQMREWISEIGFKPAIEAFKGSEPLPWQNREREDG